MLFCGCIKKGEEKNLVISILKLRYSLAMHYVHNLNTSMSPHQHCIGGFPNTVSVLKTGAQLSNP